MDFGEDLMRLDLGASATVGKATRGSSTSLHQRRLHAFFVRSMRVQIPAACVRPRAGGCMFFV